MDTPIKGLLTTDEYPTGVSCTVVPQSTGLFVTVKEHPTCELKYKETTVSYAGVNDRYLCFESQTEGKKIKLLVADHDIISHIQAMGAPRSFLDNLNQTMATRSRRNMGRHGIFVGLILGVGLIILGIWLGFDLIVEKAVTMVPFEWEQELGKAAAQGILDEAKVCSDPKVIAGINEIGTRLVGALHTAPYEFKIKVIDKEEVNAFALPGGSLFVNRGLIEQADDPFEVAGVVAHEIQHVMLRHGVQNVARQAGMMMLLQALIGDASAIEQFLLHSAADLAAMSYSRDQESAADITGHELMLKAKMDPGGLDRFLAKLAGKEGKTRKALSFLATHPASEERASTLQSLTKDQPKSQVIPLRFKIDDIKGRCDPIALSAVDGAD